MKKKLVPTAGSDKHNQPQQYCAFGCVAHAWSVDGSVGTMGSVYVVCCIPDPCLSCVLTARESLREEADHMFPIRTYEIGPLVSKPGKSSYPLPSEKKRLSARHALQSARIAPRPGPMCPAGLPVSEYLVFGRRVLVRREKLVTVRKFDRHTYTYGQTNATGPTVKRKAHFSEGAKKSG